MKKKRKLIFVCVAVLVLGVLLFPVKTCLDDGDSVIYVSLVYRIKKIREFGNVGGTVTQKERLSITIFGKEIYHKITGEHPYLQINENDENVNGEETVKRLLKGCKELYPDNMAPEDIFAAVKENDYVAFENLRLASGGEVWQTFYEKVLAEEKAQVVLVTYYTPGEKSQSSEECEDEYPMLFFTGLVYLPEKGFFVGSRGYQDEEPEQIESYLYLLHLEGDAPTPQATYSRYDRYVLSDDNDVTWEQLERQMYSSVILGDDVRFTDVYCDLIK